MTLTIYYHYLSLLQIHLFSQWHHPFILSLYSSLHFFLVRQIQCWWISFTCIENYFSFLRNSFTRYGIPIWQLVFQYILIFYSIFSSSSKFLLWKPLIVLWGFPCTWRIFSLLLISKFFIFDFWKFNYNVSGHDPLWV